MRRCGRPRVGSGRRLVPPGKTAAVVTSPGPRPALNDMIFLPTDARDFSSIFVRPTQNCLVTCLYSPLILRVHACRPSDMSCPALTKEHLIGRYSDPAGHHLSTLIQMLLLARRHQGNDMHPVLQVGLLGCLQGCHASPYQQAPVSSSNVAATAATCNSCPVNFYWPSISI